MPRLTEREAKRLHQRIVNQLRYQAMSEEEQIEYDIYRTTRRINARLRRISDVTQTQRYFSHFPTPIVRMESGSPRISVPKSMRTAETLQTLQRIDQSKYTSPSGLASIDAKRKKTFEEKLGIKLTDDEYKKLMKVLGEMRELYGESDYERYISIIRSSDQNIMASHVIRIAEEISSKAVPTYTPVDYSGPPIEGTLRYSGGKYEIYTGGQWNEYIMRRGTK